MGFKELCPSVPQNLIRNVKYGGSSKSQGTFLTMCTKILDFPPWEKNTVVGKLLATDRKEQERRGRCVDW